MSNYTTHNRSSIDINGTHLQGYVDCSYDKLTKVFGKPNEGDGYKVDAEWDILFSDGTIATIYNYKDGVNYLGEEGLIVNDITNWHIGGHSNKAVELVKAAIEGYKPLEAAAPLMFNELERTQSELISAMNDEKHFSEDMLRRWLDGVETALKAARGEV